MLTIQLLTKEMKKWTVAHPVLMLFDVKKTEQVGIAETGFIEGTNVKM